jgi:hypothetical protein
MMAGRPTSMVGSLANGLADLWYVAVENENSDTAGSCTGRIFRSSRRLAVAETISTSRIIPRGTTTIRLITGKPGSPGFPWTAAPGISKLCQTSPSVSEGRIMTEERPMFRSRLSDPESLMVHRGAGPSLDPEKPTWISSRVSADATAKIEDARNAKNTREAAAARKADTFAGGEVILLCCIIGPWVWAMNDSGQNRLAAVKQFPTVDGQVGKLKPRKYCIMSGGPVLKKVVHQIKRKTTEK